MTDDKTYAAWDLIGVGVELHYVARMLEEMGYPAMGAASWIMDNFRTSVNPKGPDRGDTLRLVAEGFMTGLLLEEAEKAVPPDPEDVPSV